MSAPILLVEKDAPALALAAAREFAHRCRDAGERFSALLSGGETPRAMYELLAGPFRDQVPWESIHFFWGDERPVPPDHPRSNFGMAYQTLLSRVPVPAGNVHRIRGEEPDAERAAALYEQDMRLFFRLKAGELPRFDLAFLGLGEDGHTASLFPRSAALRETERLAVVNWAQEPKERRITLTLPAINNAACVIFLASGKSKDQVLRAVLEGERRPEELPAQAVRPRGELLWIVDQAAAAYIRKPAR